MVKSTCLVLALALFVVSVVKAAPTPNDDLQLKFNALQEQLNSIQNLLNKPTLEETSPNEPLQRSARYMSFQPMKKRMVSWQPMKRNVNADYSKEQVIRAIEEQLSEILRAGETLGVNADEVLQHLRQRNSGLA